MPRYYFNIHDGASNLDDEGTEFADFAEARIEAVRFAGEILKDDAHRVASCRDWHIEVTDERRIVLFRFAFTALDEPGRANPGAEPGPPL